ncbi:taurine dioxygenase [Thermopolyspora flexuosa]|jgi:taurine dioxygenase|uniref:Taurine dioxygenase n=1 Tax=Thermopolyspora flexuosa TaxID=103836 RepID=A0A543J1R5_9ACTN|nr:TauD/TfdA family dioxygenase [Thermopolyspora flexuosa]TQM76759.1 taurine dioxygenase [Thermopolyspora flexuosa]GGM86539.1 taurine dioxygenase [Thermopolyspora flexuosa]
MSSDSRFEIRKIGGRIGAEVVGVDVRDLSDTAFAEIKAALLEHKVLGFRGQELTDEDQIAFAARFGPLTGAHPTVPSVAGRPEVLAVDAEQGIRSNHWHTDVTFIRTPPSITTLRALVIPPYGGHTLVANAATAYRDLPRELREFADRLWAVHTNDNDYIRPARNAKGEAYRKVFTSRVWKTAHPVVRVHPESGERGLFVNGFAQSIVGLNLRESQAILQIFQSYVVRPENVFRWTWSPGDLLVFDNRITQHYAPDDYDDLPRKLHRVTVAGDVPVGVDGRTSHIIEGDDAAHFTPAAGAA